MGIPRQIYQAVILCIAIHLTYQQAMDEDGYFYYQRAEYPKDCQDVLTQCTESNTGGQSGVYLIKPEGYEEPFEVYCDHDTDEGGWTVFQRRIDNAVGFDRTWLPYREGFGFLNQEFWLGNDKIAYLTNQRTYRLRINMTINGQDQYVEYDKFRITDEKGYYEIVHLGAFTTSNGGIPDQMGSQLNAQFSTSDNTTSGSNCATQSGAGGWWFSGTQCNQLANLNGLYTSNSHPGIHWQSSVAVTFSEMKVKPVPST